MAQDLTVNVTIKGADKVKTEASEMTKSLNETGAAGEMAFSQLDGLLGGVPTKMKGAVGGVKKLIKGFKSLRAVAMSLGIGALVVALTSLATFFTKTQRGAEMLEKAQAALGATFAVITDKVSAFGEGLINLFTNPLQALQNFGDSIKEYVFERVQLLLDGLGMLGGAISKLFKGDFSGAAAAAAEGFLNLNRGINPVYMAMEAVVDVGAQVVEVVSEIGSQAAEAATKAMALAQRSIALRAAQRDLRVEMAESRRDIKAYNLIAEDTTKGFEERIEAAQKAIAIEKDLMAERQRQAEEELRIHNERMAMSESTEEDLKQRSELQARVFELQTESLELQTTLNNKLNTLEQQRTATIEAEANKRLEAQRKADEEATKIAGEEQKRREELEKQHQAAIASLKQSAVAGTFSVLNNLSQAFEKDTEEGQKKAFKRNKAISIAETLVSTYQAAQKAYASQMAVATPDAPIRATIAAGVAVAAGLAKVAAIKSTQYTGGGGGGGGAAAGGGAVGGGGVQSVGVDVGTLVPTTTPATPGPVRAYVVSNEISNKQALDRELQIQTTL